MKTLFLALFVCTFLGAVAQDTKPADSTKVEKEGEFQKLSQPFTVNEPLFILGDQEIAQEKVSRIKADDIESITVLKDSSAVAKYGEKGKNGVIIFQLRKPKFRLE